MPVAVPVLPDDWRLASVTASRPGAGAFGWPEYALAYRRDNGACLTLLGASEGLGDVMIDEPPARRDATLDCRSRTPLSRRSWIRRRYACAGAVRRDAGAVVGLRLRLFMIDDADFFVFL